jgi:uncharacterized repeat protein (TIGR01451 family)
VAAVDAVNPKIARMKRAAALAAACLLVAIAGSLPGRAVAGVVDNTASVSYVLEGQDGQATTLLSNTVRIQVLPTPTPATLDFLRYDSSSQQGGTVPVDGGQCRIADGGFAPLPPVHDGSGAPIDPATSQTDTAPGYYAGEAIVVSVRDPNRNTDPAVREYVDVDLSVSTGDAETLRMQETGPDTGIFAGAIQSVPTPPDVVRYDCQLSVAAFAEIKARYTDNDFPLDALAVAAAGYAPLEQGRTVLRLTQTVSKPVVEIGDFVQYTLVLKNIHDAPAYAARITDTLPPGLRYRPGSLRVGGAGQPGGPDVTPAAVGAGTAGTSARTTLGVMHQVADPTIAGNGRVFGFPVGNLAPGASVTATFVAEVGPGASGPQLINEAIAHAANALASNMTDTLVTMRESMLTGRFTLIGRVAAGDCGDPASAKPVAGVRLVLEDGTFVLTDAQGAYHVVGLRPGTHVVQLDLASLPPDLEVAACTPNTRFAGRAYSQFVEGQGGSLVRADFQLRRKAGTPAPSEAGIQSVAGIAGGRIRYSVALDGEAAAVTRLRTMVVLPDGAKFVAGSTRVDGEPAADPEMTEGVATFDLGDPKRRWRSRLDFEAEPGACPASGYATKVMLMVEAGKTTQRSRPVDLPVPCGAPPGSATSQRAAVTVAAVPEGPAASPSLDSVNDRPESVSALVADGGGDVDWFKGQEPGRAFLFPGEHHNPRSPGIRIVVKYLPGDTPKLLLNGQPVDALNFDGTVTNATRTMAYGVWRGVDLTTGDNLLQVELTDRTGKVVETLERIVHRDTGAARAELVPAKSVLIADGMQRPVIAVRFLDETGHPVRQGSFGTYSLGPPYMPAHKVMAEQYRQLAGLDGAKPTWTVDGDDGIAYITLEPTGSAGNAMLGFDFGGDARSGTHQDLSAWLKAGTREWIVVGFAQGSVGYDTLARNMQALPAGEDGKGVRGDGRAALYAKGRVLGKWMLTMAYDSGKDTGALRDRNLLSTIDPNQYYTLYGDGTQQGYDAASARKLYLKLERDQFYALFGDFQTGLDRGELSRYQRTLTGVKVEYRGPLVEFSGFAAKTAQSHARDELPGDGTSGLYRLRRDGIVINSERVRIETRDRYHSEQIIESRELTRHIDYDVDYDNGTLFFREPIASRDFDFNPIWIVVDYETGGVAEEFLDAGGRAGVRMMEGRLEAGVSYIRDEDAAGTSQLAGVDAKFRLGEHDQLRAEAAASEGKAKTVAATPPVGGADAAPAGDASGNAWLVEWEHRGDVLRMLAYARRQAGAFGLGQQNAVEAGTFKAGVQTQWSLSPRWTLQAEAYRVENLANGAVRDTANAEVAYRGDGWGARAGLRWAHDTGADGRIAESRLATIGANKALLGGKLQLDANLNFALGGADGSVDFPTRLQVGGSYAITDAFRIVASQEFTDGEQRDTSTTRLGFSATPWKDARLTTTVNQSQISEYGPRTFALFGLNQRFLIGDRWGLDLAVDSSHTFSDTGEAPLVVDPAQPIATGGLRDGGALTEDFLAVSGGLTYRADLWSWNARLEGRQGDKERYGFTTAFLRQARDGVAMSASAQAFTQHDAAGGSALLATAQLSWAYRPFGGDWSMLDKLEFRLDQVERGGGQAILGNDTLAVYGNARSARLVNNFVLNYASDAWKGDGDGEGSGSVLDLYQRSQLSLYYGSKYVLDTYDGSDYAGYTDILGAEARFDLTSRIDVGLRASVLHSWSRNTFAWAFGPSIGFTPFTNAWVSVGYNIRGFNDRDFESSHYTAEGAYLVFRMKFDQHTLGLDRGSAAAGR